MKRSILLSFVAGWLGLAISARAMPVIAQVDTFQDGTLDGWGGGDVMTNVATGGPAGDGDRHMQLVSSGGAGPGSALATFNLDDRWLGNYPAAGVFAISADLRAPPSNTTSPLSIRMALFGPFGSRWVSSMPYALATDGLWHHAVFSLVAPNMTQVASGSSLDDTLAGVQQIMFRHSVEATAGATTYAGTLAIDNATAVVPIAGDTNGDNVVNGDDFARIDAGFVALAAGYNNGDFNFDQTIDADDYYIIDRSYANGGLLISEFISVGPSAVQAVPEPAAGVVVIVVGLLARWRRASSSATRKFSILH